MSYPTGTILARKEPKGTDDELDALDRVSVVGPSPISHASAGEWAGHGGDQIIVQPLEGFASPEIMPLEIAYSEYEIESEPDPQPTHIESAKPGRATRQLTAEEQFRQGSSDTVREKTKIKPTS